MGPPCAPPPPRASRPPTGRGPAASAWPCPSRVWRLGPLPAPWPKRLGLAYITTSVSAARPNRNPSPRSWPCWDWTPRRPQDWRKWNRSVRGWSWPVSWLLHRPTWPPRRGWPKSPPGWPGISTWNSSCWSGPIARPWAWGPTSGWPKAQTCPPNSSTSSIGPPAGRAGGSPWWVRASPSIPAATTSRWPGPRSK